MTTGVSALAQLTTSLNRFDKLNAQFSDLQRALSSGKKTTRFEGLGDDALSSLRFRNGIQESGQYINNIDRATTRIRAADNSLSLIQNQVQGFQKGFHLQDINGPTDIASLKSYASKLLEVASGNLNEQIDGRYVFAGSDFTAKPYEGRDNFSVQVADDVSDWLDGTLTTAQFMAKFETYTDADVGFSAEVISAGNVAVTADENFKVDYTVKANNASIKSMLVVSEIMAAITIPSGGDVPSKDDLQTVIKTLSTKLYNSSEGIDATLVTLKASEATIAEVRKQHVFDTSTLQTLVDNVENVDITETAVRLQNIQIQLEASFAATAAAASLSLLDFL